MRKAIITNGTDSEKAAAILLQPVITSKRAKYVRFDIKTAHGVELYLCAIDTKKKNRDGRPMSAKRQCEEYLAEHCFNDAYEIIMIRDCKKKEVELLECLFNEEDMNFQEAQTKVCYPNGDSVNE